MHPSKKIPKTYHVKIKGIIEDEKIEKLRRGIRLKDGVTAPAKVKKLRKAEENCWIEITIYEGKKAGKENNASRPDILCLNSNA